MADFRPQYFKPNADAPGSLQGHGTRFAELQRGVNWWIGDLARYAEARWPDTWQQVFPEWVSPGLIDRCKAVAKAYPNEEDRNPLCTWTQHMQVANKPNRTELLEEIATQGLTSDESRKATNGRVEARTDGPPATRWLLAVDCNYWLTRTYKSGDELGAGNDVAAWIGRTVERLKVKGLTDVACCFDSTQSFRKELTKDWEDKYKGKRGAKDSELFHQLHVLRNKLEAAGFLCVDRDGFEGDDLLASYARQFAGDVTLLVRDKDLWQCLSEKCNALLDVEWYEDPTSGESLPDYKWYPAGPSKRLLQLREKREAATDPKEIEDLDKEIAKAERPNLLEDTGLRADQWADYQAIWGDSVDDVKGAPGIGEVIAKDLIMEFGTLDAVLAAARDEDERIKPKKRQALIQLTERVDVVRQLVTLRTDVNVPMDTRVSSHTPT